MGLTEIIVIAVVALFMGGMGALVYYANSPVKKDSTREAERK
jgi:hypothetical protein